MLNPYSDNPMEKAVIFVRDRLFLGGAGHLSCDMVLKRADGSCLSGSSFFRAWKSVM